MAVPRLSAPPATAAQELAALLRGLLSHERDIVADFLVYLAEFDRRGFAVALGYGSLFAYCTRALGLSSSAAYRRITAARLLRRFPVLEPMLRDGRLSPTTVSLLKDVLVPATHRELLARAAGLSKEQVAALVALLRPKAAPRDSVRPLPPARLVALPSAAVDVPAPSTTPATRLADGAQVLVAVQPIPPPRVEPITADLRVLKVTVTREFLAELEEVKAALSHTVPSGRFEEVVRACFRLVLDRHRRRSAPRAPSRRAAPSTAHAAAAPASPALTSAAPAPASPAAAPTDAGTGTTPVRVPVSAEVERQVRLRDGNRCAVVGPDGHMCGSIYQLEFHHRRPVARGGETTVDNLILACRRHNDWLARLEFGEGHMERCRLRRLSRVSGRDSVEGTAASGSTAASASSDRVANADPGGGAAGDRAPPDAPSR